MLEPDNTVTISRGQSRDMAVTNPQNSGRCLFLTAAHSDPTTENAHWRQNKKIKNETITKPGRFGVGWECVGVRSGWVQVLPQRSGWVKVGTRSGQVARTAPNDAFPA